MAIAELPIELTEFLLTNVGKIGLYMQAIGLIVLIWLGFQMIDLRMNYIMKKKIVKIEKDVLEIKTLLRKKKQ